MGGCLVHTKTVSSFDSWGQGSLNKGSIDATTRIELKNGGRDRKLATLEACDNKDKNNKTNVGLMTEKLDGKDKRMGTRSLGE